MAGREFKHGLLYHRIVGVWPEDDQFLGKFGWAKGYAWAFASFVVFLMQYSALPYVDDPDVLPDYVIEAIATTIGMVKVVPFIMNRKTMLDLLQMTVDTRESSKLTDVEFKIYKRWQNYQDSLIKLCIRSYVSIVILYMSTPMLTDKPFPLQTFLPNVTYYYPWYPVVYAVECLFMSSNLFGSLSSDAFYITFMCQLCCKLELVQYSMTMLEKRNKKCVPRAIERHAIALDYGERVCDSLATTFLLQHLVISIFLCFSGITILKTKNSIILIKTVIVVILVVLTLLVICVVGELVTLASLGIADTLQNNLDEFLDEPMVLRSLSLILCRAQKPLRIIIGWQRSINLKFFTDTINKLVSAFMILKTVMD